MSDTVNTVFTTNGKIAIKPVQAAAALKIKTNKSFATAEQKTALSECEVVFHTFDPLRYGSQPGLALLPGDKVYLRGDSLAVFAPHVNELDGVQYVLIEASTVQMVKTAR